MSRRLQICSVILLTAFLTTFTSSALNLSVLDISESFHCSATTVTWVVSGYTLVIAAFAVPFGHLADMTSHRRILLLGALLFGVAGGVAVCAPGIFWLIGCRLLQGLGGTMIFSSNNPILLNAFPPAHRGRILGLSVTATYIGLTLGPALGGFLTASLGWRSVFAVTVFLCLIILIWGVLCLPKETEKENREKDISGNLLYIVMISLLTFGLSCWHQFFYGKWLALLGLLLFPVFFLWEKDRKQPILDLALFREDLGYSLSNLTALLNYGATFAVSYTMSIYLQRIQGWPASRAGLILVIQPAVMALVSPWAGWLSERVPPHKLASAGMGVIGMALFLLSGIGPETTTVFLILCLFLLGFGFGIFSSPNTNAVMSAVDSSRYGEANSILSTMRTLGQSISMVIVMMIFGLSMGNQMITEVSVVTLNDAIRNAMAIYALVCLVGMLISLARGKASR